MHQTHEVFFGSIIIIGVIFCSVAIVKFIWVMLPF